MDERYAWIRQFPLSPNMSILPSLLACIPVAWDTTCEIYNQLTLFIADGQLKATLTTGIENSTTKCVVTADPQQVTAVGGSHVQIEIPEGFTVIRIDRSIYRPFPSGMFLKVLERVPSDVATLIGNLDHLMQPVRSSGADMLQEDQTDHLFATEHPNFTHNLFNSPWWTSLLMGRFSGTIGWDPSVCKSNRLHVRHPPVFLY